MSELRFNRLTGDWVVIASERAGRPQSSRPRPVRDVPAFSANCPFCPGNGGHGEQVMAEPEHGSWRFRILQNRFPALVPEGVLGVAGGLMDRKMVGVGYHELVIETPHHNRLLWEQSDDDVAE